MKNRESISFEKITNSVCFNRWNFYVHLARSIFVELKINRMLFLIFNNTRDKDKILPSIVMFSQLGEISKKQSQKQSPSN